MNPVHIPITVPVSSPDCVVITPDLARQIVALGTVKESLTVAKPADDHTEKRPCKHCGYMHLFRKSPTIGWHPIEYHDCEVVLPPADNPAADQGGDATVRAIQRIINAGDCYHDDCGEARDVMAAIKRGEIPGVRADTTPLSSYVPLKNHDIMRNDRDQWKARAEMAEAEAVKLRKRCMEANAEANIAREVRETAEVTRLRNIIETAAAALAAEGK